MFPQESVDVVLVPADMSIACELSNPNSKKTKAEKRITTKILLIRVLCGLVVLWLCLSLSLGFLCICKKKEAASDDESSSSAKGMLFRNQKNVSRSEIDAMLSLFFDSNQVSHNFFFCLLFV